MLSIILEKNGLCFICFIIDYYSTITDELKNIRTQTKNNH